MPSTSTKVKNKGRFFTPRIIIKFNEIFTIPYQDEKRITQYLNATQIFPWSKTFQKSPSIRISRLFNSISVRKIQLLQKRALENDLTYKPVNFFSYFVIDCGMDFDVNELLAVLKNSRNIEHAYIQSPPLKPPVNASNDPRSMNQGYLNAAPAGIDARYAWTVAGGDGTGTVKFIDIEQGWILTHEDIIGSGITLLSGINSNYFDHGAAVLGEILMQDNALGGVGITPNVKGNVISQQRPDMSYNTPDAIMTAVDNLSFGDIIVLEAQVSDTPLTPFRLFPVEIEAATFDVIRLATAIGITVVEAGCNGDLGTNPVGNDLDLFIDGSGKQILNTISIDYKDSGAIIVAAASDVAPHTRLGFSNYGSRINCYAWGMNVDTAGYSPAGANNSYTTTFGGTSSATPIIAGCAIAVQSIADTSFQYKMNPFQLRTILSDPLNGTASANPITDRIGVMPDLKKIIDNVIALTPDIYIRDKVGDMGDKQTGDLFRSPDIILKNKKLTGSSQTEYGEGSGTENDEFLSDQIIAGQNHFIYLRMRNRGGLDANNVTARVYWAESATLITPNLWNYIGETIVPTVSSGNYLTVSKEIVWPANEIPPPGHYCFIALVETAEDPMPDINLLLNWNTFFAFIGNNNNVAWRNFDIIPLPPPTASGFSEMDFMSPGAPQEAIKMSFEVGAFLPEGSQVFLQVSLLFLDLIMQRSPYIKIDRKKQVAIIPLKYCGIHVIGELMYPAGIKFKMKLLVKLPKISSQSQFEIFVRQVYQRREVGRITWKLKQAIIKRTKQ